MILGVDHLSFEGVEVSDVEKKILQAYFHQKIPWTLPIKPIYARSVSQKKKKHDMWRKNVA